MKKLLLLSMLSFGILACKETGQDYAVQGKWQNTSNQKVVLEFTGNGEYLVCIGAECIDDPLRYQYDAAATDYNLTFSYDETDTLKHLGKVSFIDQNSIALELYTKDKQYLGSGAYKRL